MNWLKLVILIELWWKKEVEQSLNFHVEPFKRRWLVLNENNPSYFAKSGDGLFFVIVIKEFVA